MTLSGSSLHPAARSITAGLVRGCTPLCPTLRIPHRHRRRHCCPDVAPAPPRSTPPPTPRRPQGYAFNTYGETVACWLQDIVIVGLIFAHLRLSLPVVAAATLAFGATCWWMMAGCSVELLGWLNLSTVAVMAIGARIPQIVLNARRGDVGGCRPYQGRRGRGCAVLTATGGLGGGSVCCRRVRLVLGGMHRPQQVDSRSNVVMMFVQSCACLVSLCASALPVGLCLLLSSACMLYTQAVQAPTASRCGPPHLQSEVRCPTPRCCRRSGLPPPSLPTTHAMMTCSHSQRSPSPLHPPPPPLLAGMMSLATCVLNVVGNAVRVFTTLVLTKDWVILLGCVTQGLLNVVLLYQALTMPPKAAVAPAASASGTAGDGADSGSAPAADGSGNGNGVTVKQPAAVPVQDGTGSGPGVMAPRAA